MSGETQNKKLSAYGIFRICSAVIYQSSALLPGLGVFK